MKVHFNLDEIPEINNAIVTQGTFDGVHVAHRVILNRLKELAVKKNGETVVITFHPHPRMVLFPDDHGLKLLHTLNEKIKALEVLDIDHLIIIPFTREFSRLSSLQFIRDILVKKINTYTLVIGYNHRFGKNREGTFKHLIEFAPVYGFAIEEIPEQDIELEAVSSTRIRQALETGNITQANKNLGYYYSLIGKVMHGKQLGRTIGFPTANIELGDPTKLIPADGVYAVEVFINKKIHLGMLNCGFRPTVDGVTHAIEVHIFNFDENIYDQTIKISFVDKLRNEIKFADISELKTQLENDKLHALEIFNKQKLLQ